MGSRDNFELANQRAKELQTSFPKAVSARYDRKNRRIEIQLSSNLNVSFSPRLVMLRLLTRVSQSHNVRASYRSTSASISSFASATQKCARRKTSCCANKTRPVRAINID